MTLPSYGQPIVRLDDVDLSNLSIAGEAAGDLIQFDGAQWNRLPIGSDDDVLIVTAGAPTWSATLTDITLAGTPTVTGDMTFEDNIAILLGTGGAESDLSSDGINTIWNFTSGNFTTQFSGAGGFVYSAGALAFQEETTLSTTAGKLIFDGMTRVATQINGAEYLDLEGASVGNYLWQFSGTKTGVASTQGIVVVINNQGVANGVILGMNYAPTLTEAGAGNHSLVIAMDLNPTFTGGAATTTTAATLRVASVPGIATNNYGFWHDTGLLRWDDPIALGGGAAPTLGTIGGAGPAAAAQNQWLRVNIDGTNNFIPVWQ